MKVPNLLSLARHSVGMIGDLAFLINQRMVRTEGVQLRRKGIFLTDHNAPLMGSWIVLLKTNQHMLEA